MNLLKSRIIQGTLLLTAAGFITRILGFFYRIFLADKLGAAVLGSYQLIFPIFAICSSIYGAGVQTAISQLIAAEQGKRSKLCSSDSPTAKGLTTFQNTIEQNCRAILLLGCILSFLLAGSLTFWVYTKADWIAARFIMAPECAPYLQIMCMLFPFCGVGACINGYYYGIQNATVPSITQIVEQISRLSFVFMLLIIFPGSAEHNCIIAVWGIVVGEIVSAVYNVYKYMHQPKKDKANALSSFRHGLRHYSVPLLSLSTSLTGTKLIIALLHSAESVFIAAALRQYGCST
ncbi:MAG: oligosaccharide flippase family protein, partial [Clostridium sp.]